MVLCFAALFAGCAVKQRPYTADEAVRAIQAQAGEVRTARGRAWVSMKLPERKISFPAVAAMDFTGAAPRMRLEFNDAFGATHVLVLVNGELTLVDYDSRRVVRLAKTWYGLPVASLPRLMLGLAVIPSGGAVGAAGPDGFAVRSEGNSYRFAMSWIAPGPRLALSEIEAEARASATAKDRYVVRYSKFRDKADFYLPRDADLSGQTAKGSVEVAVTWRNQDWNETIDSGVFEVPKGIEKFTRE